MSQVAPIQKESTEYKNISARLIGPAVLNEIRNPLTNIVLSLDLLELHETGVDPKIYFDIIRRNVVRVNTLLSALLEKGVRVEAQEDKMARLPE